MAVVPVVILKVQLFALSVCQFQGFLSVSRFSVSLKVFCQFEGFLSVSRRRCTVHQALGADTCLPRPWPPLKHLTSNLSGQSGGCPACSTHPTQTGLWATCAAPFHSSLLKELALSNIVCPRRQIFLQRTEEVKVETLI